METRGLNDLGYKIFLDRYAIKDTKRETLQVGDLVLIKTDDNTGQKEVGFVEDIKEGKALVNLIDGSATVAVDIEAVDKPLELDPADMWKRVAHAMAEVERDSGAFDEWHDKFLYLLEDWKFIPGGRILAGAGTDTELTYYNCYVLSSPHDSKEGIFKTLNHMAQIMARGGGVGINLSSLRPRYAYAKSTNGRSSGAVSWAEIYSYTTGLIEQGGSRRGALMLILNDWHPDIMEFINVKRDMKRILNANISVGFSETFMDKVEADEDWQLRFPDTTHPDYDAKWDGDLLKWVANGLPTKVWKTIKARELWNAVVESAWASAEPGIWFKGRSNAYSNSFYYAPLIATNPCAEQPLPAWSVCLLGSLNLSKFVRDGHMEWDQLEKAIHYAVRFMDNVIDATPYIYPEMETQQKDERRIGLGTMGLAEVLIRLKIRYGSKESIEFIHNLYRFIACQAYYTSVELAKERGVFPKYSTSIFNSEFVKGLPDDLKSQIRTHGLRNVTLLTQAPTGSIGTMANTSTGIEPFYFWEYERKGRLGSHIERVKVYDEWRTNQPPDDDEPLPDYFVTAQDLTPEEHVRVQAAIQRWVDSSISKTCNVPADYTVGQVGQLYQLMYELGCKGGTIYRDGSRNEQILNLIDNTDSKDKTHSGTEEHAPTQLSIRSRPAIIAGKTYKKTTPTGNAFITVNTDENGHPFETFINIGKAGSDVACDAEAIGRLVSMAFRASNGSIMSCVTEIVSQLRGIGGKSAGFGPNRVSSVADALAQVLEAEYLIKSDAEPMAQYVTAVTTGDICPGCGNASLMRVEGCQKCHGCGYSIC